MALMVDPKLFLLMKKHIVKLKKIFWIYLCENFIISDMSDYEMVEPPIKCEFIPITMDNYNMVADFREEGRISEYREKLVQKEIGFFVKNSGKMISSIWATINREKAPNVVRTFIKLMPNEGLIHDIVVREQYRGMSIGPFMLGKIATILLREYGLSRVTVDVNIKNRASLRMMKKSGLRLDHIMFYISVFNKRVLYIKLKQYAQEF